MEEKLLIKRAKKGDKEALLMLVMNQKTDYYKLAYVYMKNEEDALDIMQEMIVILYQNISKLKKDEAFYSWSKTILVNCCKNMIKNNKNVILFIGYNIDAISYYGKKLIGYENVMNSTLKELDKLGKGQIIDKSYQFKDGSKITLDAIMLDTNNLVMFYIIYDPTGNVEEVYSDLEVLNLEGRNTIRTRTVEFKGTGEKLKLNIQEIRYKKHYNQTIYKQIIM